MSAECTHPVQLHGLCALCGADVEHVYEARGPDDAAEDANRVLLLHDASLGLRVAPAEARRIEADMQGALLRAHKLSLILDLDQTVVHATVSRPAVDAALAAGRCALGDVHRILLPETPDTPYWVVLRPGVASFLSAMAERFEMHVYTMGSRSYARAVSALLDPAASYFYDRVLSREDVLGDGTEPVRKSLRRLFPGDDRTVLIVDDRPDVWDYSPNLLPVHPYVCFPHAVDMNAIHAGGALPCTPPPPGSADDLPPEVCEDIDAPADEPDTGQDLRTLADVLCHVHSEFFRELEEDGPRPPDVKAIARRRVARVLAGVRLAFTGVLPRHMEPQHTDAWRMAAFFGAACDAEQVPGHTTHVVAARNDTVKARRAFVRGDALVVRPEWLHACYRRYRCVDPAAVGAMHVPPACDDNGTVCSAGDVDAYPPPEDGVLDDAMALVPPDNDPTAAGAHDEVPLLSASQIADMQAEIDALGSSDSEAASFTSESVREQDVPPAAAAPSEPAAVVSPSSRATYGSAVYDDDEPGAPDDRASIADEDFDAILASADDPSDTSDRGGRLRDRTARGARAASRSPSTERPAKRGRARAQ